MYAHTRCWYPAQHEQSNSASRYLQQGPSSQSARALAAHQHRLHAASTLRQQAQHNACKLCCCGTATIGLNTRPVKRQQLQAADCTWSGPQPEASSEHISSATAAAAAAVVAAVLHPAWLLLLLLLYLDSSSKFSTRSGTSAAAAPGNSSIHTSVWSRDSPHIAV
jgi:Flp pilus assembly protein TadB